MDPLNEPEVNIKVIIIQPVAFTWYQKDTSCQVISLEDKGKNQTYYHFIHSSWQMDRSENVQNENENNLITIPMQRYIIYAPDKPKSQL